MKGDFTRSTFRKEKHYSSVRMQQGRVQLDADWNEQLDITDHRRATESSDVVGLCGAPKDNAGFAVEPQVDQADTLQIKAGRYYVDGILCENEQDELFTQQPDLIGVALPKDIGMYVAYLDVWERHITALEDSEIREVALGGPDTATRTKTVWQVKLEKVGEVEDEADCSEFGPGWLPQGVHFGGRLRARTQAEAASDQPCILPAQAGYRRLENQLYRVEIHDSGPDGIATFKYSRDNGFPVTRLEKIEAKNITVADLGKGELLRFAPGQWVELSDEEHVLRGEPGILVELAAVEGKQLTVVDWPNGSPPEIGQKPTVRSWDSQGAITVITDDVDIKDGVRIQFLAAEYRSGDYWMIPARTAPGDVLWPVNEASGEALFRAPHGIDHHYCALALLQFNEGNWSNLSDCRQLFPPLTGLKADEPGIHITDVLTKNKNGDDISVRNNTEVPVDSLAKGLRIVCDDSIDPEAVRQKPTCYVTLDMPFPFNSVDQDFWGKPVIGFQPLILAADVDVIGDNDEIISWNPTSDTHSWLQDKLFQNLSALDSEIESVLVHLTLKGNFINNGDKYLDGEAFGFRELNSPQTELRLPSGDRMRGGDFEMWFWLVSSGRSVPQIDVQPDPHNFGNVRLKKTSTKTFTVSNTGAAPLNVKGVATRNTRFRVTPTDPFNLAPNSQKNLQVVFAPTKVGAESGQLILISNDRVSPTTTVLLEGTGVAAAKISVQPPSINFGSVATGGVKNANLTVKNSGSARLDVSLSTDKRFFQASPRNFSVKPGGQQQVRLIFVAPGIGSHQGKLILANNDPDKRRVTVNLSGTGRRRVGGRGIGAGLG